MSTYQYKAGFGKRLNIGRWVATGQHVGGNFSEGYTQSMPDMILGKPSINITEESYIVDLLDLEIDYITVTGTFAKTQAWSNVTATIQIGMYVLDLSLDDVHAWSIDIPKDYLVETSSNYIVAFIYWNDPFTGAPAVNSDTATYTLIGDIVPPIPTYALSRSDASIAEGEFVTITLTTTNVANGTAVPYTITGVDSVDIEEPLTGAFIVQDGTAEVVIHATTNPLPPIGPNSTTEDGENITTEDGINITIEN